MNVYTLQIGSGKNNDMQALEHSETIGAKDLVDAISQAKNIVRSGSWQTDSTLVRLLQETDGDSVVVWFRPMETVRRS